MIPSQTSQALLGATVAFAYGAAVMAIGTLLLALLVRQRHAIIRAHIGLLGFLWLSFVIGQGILGVAWLILSLAGMLHSTFVWNVCVFGWALACVRLFLLHPWKAQFVERTRATFVALRDSDPWYLWVGLGIAIVALLRGVIALLPPSNDDALRYYLVGAKIIADSHSLELLPFLPPLYGLLPMQVEVHWAALFAISNETAVTVWDYLCALSFLCGIGFLAWSITSNRRVALVAILMMLSTPAFYALMGGGKVDNASAQYYAAAFVWLTLWPALGHRAGILAGLCVGWALASRYTNVIVLPGVILFAIMMTRGAWRASTIDVAEGQLNRSWVSAALMCGIAAGVAGAPMLIKNWLLVGCPLAPQLGCEGTFWASIYRAHISSPYNFSVGDLFFYPFVWTFAVRDGMLGNISPLFIGFFPFLLAYRRFPIVKSALAVGLAGVVSIMTWLLIEPLFLATRFLLAPLALLAVPISAAVVAVEQDPRQGHTVRWPVKAAVAAILFFLLFEGRGVVYTGRYLDSMDSRADRFQSFPGYDVAVWLNAHMQPGQRVGLANYGGYRYFVDPHILLNSESAEEIQWLWEHGEWLNKGLPSSWSPDFWHLYESHGFTYIVVAKHLLQEAISAWPDNSARVPLEVVAMGRDSGVLKIQKQQALYKAVSAN
jgi:hypothetical protein